MGAAVGQRRPEATDAQAYAAVRGWMKGRDGWFQQETVAFGAGVAQNLWIRGSQAREALWVLVKEELVTAARLVHSDGLDTLIVWRWRRDA